MHWMVAYMALPPEEKLAKERADHAELTAALAHLTAKRARREPVHLPAITFLENRIASKTREIAKLESQISESPRKEVA